MPRIVKQCCVCRRTYRRGLAFWPWWWGGVAGILSAVAGHGTTAALTAFGLAFGLAALLRLRKRWVCYLPKPGERVSHGYCLECFEAEMHKMDLEEGTES